VGGEGGASGNINAPEILSKIKPGSGAWVNGFRVAFFLLGRFGSNLQRRSASVGEILESAFNYAPYDRMNSLPKRGLQEGNAFC
jgi:hypothetical protein